MQSGITLYINLLDFVLRSSSLQAKEINRLHIYFYEAAGIILLVVIATTIFMLKKFKQKNGEVQETKTLSARWEIPMIGIPLVLVVFFFYMSLRTMQHVLPSAEGKQPDVVITGHQFWWEAQYPANGVVTANEIHLPVGKTILLKLNSADVIHDWWVPQFGNKMDLINGRDNYLWVNITAPGIYKGACSEFCGAQHAGMFIQVIAQNEDDYNKWLAHFKQSAVPVNNELIQKGAQIFQMQTCGNCHGIKGTNARGRAGPDLTHLASRSTLLTGLLINNRYNLKQWIQDPQKIKPGANMPNFFLDKSSMEALVTYLSSLQ